MSLIFSKPTVLIRRPFESLDTPVHVFFATCDDICVECFGVNGEIRCIKLERIMHFAERDAERHHG